MITRVEISDSRDLLVLTITDTKNLTNFEIGTILQGISKEFLDENKYLGDIGLDALGKNNGGIDDTGVVGRPQLPEVLESELYQLTNNNISTKAD